VRSARWSGRGIDVRIDLAGAQHLEPALALAQIAARPVSEESLSVAVKAGHVHLHARLGEGEEVRAQPDLAAVSERRAREHQERPLEVRQRDVLIDRESSIWWNWGVCVASESGR